MYLSSPISMTAYSQPKDNSGLLHLAVAILFFPLYFILGGEFKIVMSIYAMYLLFAGRADFYPALLVHFLPGTTVSIAILIGCVALSLTKYRTLREYRVHWLFVMAFLPLLLVVYVAIQKDSIGNETWLEILVWLSLYLGPFGFFYGVLISQDLDRKLCLTLLWIYFLLLLFQISGLYFSNMRGVVLAITAFPLIFLVDFTRILRLHLPFLVRILAITTIGILAARLLSLSFIIVGILILSLAIILTRQFMAGAIKKLPIGRIFGLIAILATIYLAGYASQNLLVSRRVMSISEIRSVDDILPAMEFKAYGDRAPLWTAAWNTIKAECGLLPPVHTIFIGYTQKEGVAQEVEFGAHNVGLELLRNFGFIAGLAGIMVYLVILGLMGRVLAVDFVDPLIFLLGVVVFSITFVGGLLGHFVLIDSFSFALFSLGGLIYGYCQNSSKNVSFRRTVT